MAEPKKKSKRKLPTREDILNTHRLSRIDKWKWALNKLDASLLLLFPMAVEEHLNEAKSREYDAAFRQAVADDDSIAQLRARQQHRRAVLADDSDDSYERYLLELHKVTGIPVNEIGEMPAVTVDRLAAAAIRMRGNKDPWVEIDQAEHFKRRQTVSGWIREGTHKDWVKRIDGVYFVVQSKIRDLIKSEFWPMYEPKQ